MPSKLVDLRIPSQKGAEITDVNVLIRIFRAYSESDFALEVYVDPWDLVEDGRLTYKKNWLLPVYVRENTAEPLRRAVTSNVGKEDAGAGKNSTCSHDGAGLASSDGIGTAKSQEELQVASAKPGHTGFIKVLNSYLSSIHGISVR